MEFKKTIPILIAIMMMGALIGVQAASATTSQVVIYNDDNNQVTSFNSNSNDQCLAIYGRLYVDGEWRAMRHLTFDVRDPNGNQLIHVTKLTSALTGYTGIGIWNVDLFKWMPGDYTVTVSYPGNEAKGWPTASTTAVIHHTKL